MIETVDEFETGEWDGLTAFRPSEAVGNVCCEAIRRERTERFVRTRKYRADPLREVSASPVARAWPCLGGCRGSRSAASVA